MVGLGATNVMVYWGIVAVSQAGNYFRKYQEREFRLAQARSNGDQDLVLQNGQQLMLSRNYRDRFFTVLGDL